MGKAAWWALGLTLVACSGCSDSDDPSSVCPSAASNTRDQLITAVESNTTGCPSSPTEICGTFQGSCEYDVSCQSGIVRLKYACTPGEFTLATLTSSACENPYDFCPALNLLCNEAGAWQRIGGTDEQPACPWDRPARGASCANGPFVIESRCGYRCDSDTGWAVAACQPTNNGTWHYDAGCACE